MERHRIGISLLALSLLALVLSACAPQAISGVATQIAATGLAEANGALATVRAAETPRISTAVPTPLPLGATATLSAGIPVTGATGSSMTATSPVMPTLPPPTSTMAPTFTSVPTMGSSESLATATPVVPVTGATVVPTTSTSGCNQPLNVAAAGPTVTLFINNRAGSPIDVTIGLPRANSLGQCGFVVLGPIQPSHTLRVALPENQIALGDSCYWAYAVITNQGRQSIVSGSGFCLDVTRTWTLNVHTDRLRLATP